MGIEGLLNLLKPITEKEHISTFKNQRIAIDAMPWIYKGCYSCAFDLNQNI
jgi:exonuclease-1